MLPLCFRRIISSWLITGFDRGSWEWVSRNSGLEDFEEIGSVGIVPIRSSVSLPVFNVVMTRLPKSKLKVRAFPSHMRYFIAVGRINLSYHVNVGLDLDQLFAVPNPELMTVVCTITGYKWRACIKAEPSTFISSIQNRATSTISSRTFGLSKFKSGMWLEKKPIIMLGRWIAIHFMPLWMLSESTVTFLRSDRGWSLLRPHKIIPVRRILVGHCTFKTRVIGSRWFGTRSMITWMPRLSWWWTLVERAVIGWMYNPETSYLWYRKAKA